MLILMTTVVVVREQKENKLHLYMTDMDSLSANCLTNKKVLPFHPLLVGKQYPIH